MIRLATSICLLLCLSAPLNVAAFWLNDGQCSDESAIAVESAVVEASDTNCGTLKDPSDPSYNACFELAENPISTLPELIAQTQAERVVAALLDTTQAVTTSTTPAPPLPTDASIEDPELPGAPLAARPPSPRPRPNSCAVYPDDCESAPVVPTLNLEGSVPQADDSSSELDVLPPPTPEMRRGPPCTGVGDAAGVASRLDRPPQAR